MHAKLPAIMIVKKINSSTKSTIGLTLKPVRSDRTSLIVGRSPNVQSVASTADQTIRRATAHGTAGGREGASSGCIEGGYHSSIEAAKFKPHCLEGWPSG